MDLFFSAALLATLGLSPTDFRATPSVKLGILGTELLNDHGAFADLSTPSIMKARMAVAANPTTQGWRSQPAQPPTTASSSAATSAARRLANVDAKPGDGVIVGRASARSLSRRWICVSSSRQLAHVCT